MARKKKYVKNFEVKWDADGIYLDTEFKCTVPERNPDFINRGKDMDWTEEFWFEEGIRTFFYERVTQDIAPLMECSITHMLMTTSQDDDDNNWIYADKQVQPAYSKWKAEKALIEAVKGSK